jgi:hypothetical protein
MPPPAVRNIVGLADKLLLPPLLLAALAAASNAARPAIGIGIGITVAAAVVVVNCGLVVAVTASTWRLRAPSNCGVMPMSAFSACCIRDASSLMLLCGGKTFHM